MSESLDQHGMYLDPQEIEHVEFDIVDIPDDPYAPVITPDDVV